MQFKGIYGTSSAVAASAVPEMTCEEILRTDIAKIGYT
jgi:hypothetical protein